MKFRKKPVVIEAMQLTRRNYDVVFRWITIENNGLILESNNGEFREDSCYFIIKTLEGKHIASENDYIIKGVKGEFYPCKPDIFEMTYEKVDD